MNAGIKLAAWLCLLPGGLSAQGFLDGFSYEGLRFSGIGFEFGVVTSSRVTTEPTGALRIDYGMIAPNIRLLLGATYSKGDFDTDEIAEFENRLQGVVDDPTGDFSIDVGRITWAAFEADVDLQYVFTTRTRVTPYVGVGFAAHILNGAGPAIEGTFVEDALDTIDAGINLSAGAMVALSSQWHATGDVRGGVTSEMRTLAFRFGLMYRVQR